MRQLTEHEISHVSGGNFLLGVFAIIGTYNTGKYVGGQFNDAFKSATGTSLGTYIYNKTH